MPTILDCKTVCIFAYLSRREQSNKRSETSLKTESETGERRKKAVRFTDFFTDFEKKKPTVLQSTTIQGCKQRQKRRWEKTCHKERKVNTKMKVTLRMNTLMKARVEMITFRVMPMKIMFPHPSAFQRGKFFSIIRRQNRTRLAGKMQKNNVFKPQLLEMKLNWIHIITSSMWVQMHTFTLAITVFFSSWCLSQGLTFFE